MPVPLSTALREGFSPIGSVIPHTETGAGKGKPDFVRVTANCIPWDAMSLEQRAEHLVHAHGYNEEWWYRDYKSLVTEQQDDKINAYLDTKNAVIAYLITSAAHLSWDRMKEMHDEDHSEYIAGGGPVPHVHAKKV